MMGWLVGEGESSKDWVSTESTTDSSTCRSKDSTTSIKRVCSEASASASSFFMRTLDEREAMRKYPISDEKRIGIRRGNVE